MLGDLISSDTLLALVQLALLIAALVAIYQKWIKPRFPGFRPVFMVIASVGFIGLIMGAWVWVANNDSYMCGTRSYHIVTQASEGGPQSLMRKSDDPQVRADKIFKSCQIMLEQCADGRAGNYESTLEYCRRFLADPRLGTLSSE